MTSIEGYLDQLASESPVPGGGSAAAIIAAAGAALVAMVARICLQSKKYTGEHPLAQTILRRAEVLRAGLLRARAIDEAAFSNVVEAQALPKPEKSDRTDEAAARREARAQALESALTTAAQTPLHTARLALDVEKLAVRLFDIPNRNLVSDIGCAAEFARSGVMACGYNVRINHRFMYDRETIVRQDEEMTRYEREATALLHTIRRAIRQSVKIERPAS